MQKKTESLFINQFHDRMLDNPDWPAVEAEQSLSRVWRWIETNHKYNTLLWNEEDKARRTDVGSDAIATSKRLIDQYNQERNDAVEAIDEAMLSELEEYPRMEGARLHSETAGAMIDRLSILSLKIHHMREQTQRVDASEDHIEKCSAKLSRLIMQRQDLSVCFDELLRDARQGLAYFKVYRQFKMYNDPALNPYLYRKAVELATGGAAL